MGGKIIRTYKCCPRETLEESGDFDEKANGNGYPYSTDKLLRPGDIIIVKAQSSAHPEYTSEKYTRGELPVMDREMVVLWGKQWYPTKIQEEKGQTSPSYNREVVEKIVGSYQFKHRPGLNDPELRERYWTIIRPDNGQRQEDRYWKHVLPRLRRFTNYGSIDYVEVPDENMP